MGFGGEVDDCGWPMFPQQLSHQAAVGNVPCDEAKPASCRQSGQVVGSRGIGTLVNRDYRDLRLFEPGLDEVRADEPGPAGYEYGRLHKICLAFHLFFAIPSSRCLTCLLEVLPIHVFLTSGVVQRT